MPSLRSTTTASPGSAGANSVARPAGLETTDVVVLVVVTNHGSTLSFSCPGFDDVFYGEVPGDVEIGVLVGTGFSAGGTWTVTPSNGSAWIHLAATAWIDADTDLIVGTPIAATQPAAIPSITTTRPDTVVLAAMGKSYSSIASVSPGAFLTNIGDGSHGWVYARTPQATPGPSGTTTFSTAHPWDPALGVHLGIQPPADDPTPEGGADVTVHAHLAAGGVRASTGTAAVEARATVTPVGSRTSTGATSTAATAHVSTAGARPSTGTVDLVASAAVAATGARPSTGGTGVAAAAGVSWVGHAPSHAIPTGHFHAEVHPALEAVGARPSVGHTALTARGLLDLSGARPSAGHALLATTTHAAASGERGSAGHAAAHAHPYVRWGDGTPTLPSPERTWRIDPAPRTLAVAAAPRRYRVGAVTRTMEA